MIAKKELLKLKIKQLKKDFRRKEKQLEKQGDKLDRIRDKEQACEQRLDRIYEDYLDLDWKIAQAEDNLNDLE